MKIGIVGAGALGLYYGAMLQRSGEDVHFLLRSDYQTLSQQGLQVYSVNGDFKLAQINGYRSTAEIGPVELVVVGLKTFANDRLIELVRPLVGPDTAILTLQNGLGNEELLAEAFAPEQVLGGVAYLCSNRNESGSIHHLGEGRIALGEFSGGISSRAEQLSAMFNRAAVPCQAVADLKRVRWEKLVWNIPFNGLTALLEKDVTEILQHPPTRELVRSLMIEIISGANAQGITHQIDAEEFSSKMIAFTDQMDHYRPSMMIDRLEGRPLELEAIFESPLKQAAEAGVEMPQISMLHALLSLGEKKPAA